MKGTWIGTYQHQSPRVPIEICNRLTRFTMEITKFDGTYFSGTIEDDLTTGGTRGIGKVKGKIFNGKIHFVKQMPIANYILPDGEIQEDNNPHRKIYYSGVFKDDIIEGEWKIKLGIGKLGNRLAIFYPIKGIWKMKKG